MDGSAPQRESRPAGGPPPAVPGTPARRASLGKTLAPLLLIVFAVLLAYSNTLEAPFTFDDNPNIVDNPAIRDLRTFLGSSGGEQREFVVRINRPLLRSRFVGFLTLALNYRLHGLEVRGYHLTNIAIHVLNALLLYWLVSLVFKTPFASAAGAASLRAGSARRVALFAALLFAVHPLQTQAVTYVIQRFASLATLFYLLALALYAAWRERAFGGGARRLPRAALYAASLLCAALAMRTKEFAFTLPAVMAMYELMFFEGKAARRLLPLAPFVLSTLLIPLALGGAGVPLAAMGGVGGAGHEGISGGEYLFTQMRVIVTYLRLLLVPVGQSVDHDYPLYSSVLHPAVLLASLFHLAAVGVGVHLCRSSGRPGAGDRVLPRLAAFGIFFFYITVSAESGFVPILDLMVEHRVYLPSIGFFVALAAAAEWAAQRWGRKAPVRRGIVSALAAAVVALGVAAYQRNAVWGDVVTLWQDAAEKAPGKARPRANLASALQDAGLHDEARISYRKALDLFTDPVDRLMVMANLGAIEMKEGKARFERGDRAAAVAHLDRGIGYLEPLFASSLGMDGAPNVSMGAILLLKHKVLLALDGRGDPKLLDRAARHFEIARYTPGSRADAAAGLEEIARLRGGTR